MVSNAQKGTYVCNVCNLQQEIVGGLNDCDPSSSSVVKMYGSKSVIRHRSGKDTADQIGEKYYKKFLELNDKYVETCIEEAIKAEEEQKLYEKEKIKKRKEVRSLNSSDDFTSSTELSLSQSNSELVSAISKTSRIPNEILISVAKTYAEVFLYSKKKDFSENGELLEVRDSRNRGSKLWSFIAYLLLQECAKQKYPFNEPDAIKFVKPQQSDVSIAVGDRIARDYKLKGYLELPQMNIAKGDENIKKNICLLGLPEENMDRFIGFTSEIMKVVTNEGVANRTEEKTQIIGSIYIIIQLLKFKVDVETISKKCKIQAKTFVNFADTVMKNPLVFHNVFVRYAIPDGINEKIVRKKKHINA
jgi:hypothetical protein